MALFPLLVILFVFAIIIKYSWSYLVKRIFPGAVEQNLIAEEITWDVAVVISILLLFVVK